jgi:hypothetical protein
MLWDDPCVKRLNFSTEVLDYDVLCGIPYDSQSTILQLAVTCGKGVCANSKWNESQGRYARLGGYWARLLGYYLKVSLSVRMTYD